MKFLITQIVGMIQELIKWKKTMMKMINLKIKMINNHLLFNLILMENQMKKISHKIIIIIRKNNKTIMMMKKTRGWRMMI